MTSSYYMKMFSGSCIRQFCPEERIVLFCDRFRSCTLDSLMVPFVTRHGHVGNPAKQTPLSARLDFHSNLRIRKVKLMRTNRLDFRFEWNCPKSSDTTWPIHSQSRSCPHASCQKERTLQCRVLTLDYLQLLENYRKLLLLALEWGINRK